MNTKWLFVAFALLTACGTRSQDTTTGSIPSEFRIPEDLGSLDSTVLRPLVFPFWMAREIALDLSEKEHLEALMELSSKERGLLRALVTGLETTNRHQSLQISSLQARNQSLEVFLKAERTKRPRDNLLERLLRMAGALGIGYVLGSLSR